MDKIWGVWVCTAGARDPPRKCGRLGVQKLPGSRSKADYTILNFKANEGKGNIICWFAISAPVGPIFWFQEALLIGNLAAAVECCFKARIHFHSVRI